jgi:radical SAM superfamily enzyme YgiQ (UPF0313 family)
MILRIALVFAKADLRRGTRIKHFMTPPHSLQLLSALTPREHCVSIVDEYHRPVDLQLEADLIGISVWTAAAPRAYALADHFRCRGIPVVLGGPHVTVCPHEAKLHADAVVVGEAESVWGRLLADFQQGRLEPVYHGEPLPLDHTPAPDWSPIAPRDYAILSSVATTRGCTRRCDFCYESCRPKPSFRRRPLEAVLREIDARPSPVIAFLDNDIMADRRLADDLLDALAVRRRCWLGMTSIEAADDEALLDRMARSGCRSLFVGFESIVAESLREVHKRCNRVETYLRNVRRIHDRGIMVNGSFVFGFDHDGPDVFEKTVRFGIEAELDTATFTVLTPYPGTALYERLHAEGRITDRDWSHYDTTRVVFQPARMSREELETGYFQAYRDFYRWCSIVHRCRWNEPGFAKRLFLNVAYKRVEPLYGLLGRPLPIGWFRPLFHWYARPFTPARRAKGTASSSSTRKSGPSPSRVAVWPSINEATADELLGLRPVRTRPVAEPCMVSTLKRLTQ